MECGSRRGHSRADRERWMSRPAIHDRRLSKRRRPVTLLPSTFHSRRTDPVTRFLALLVWLGVASFAAAQPKGKDTAVDTTYLRTLAETRSFQLGRPLKAQVTPDGKAVLFLRSEARSAKLSLFEFDVETGKTRELLTPAQVLQGAEEKLSPEEKAARERMRVSAAGFASFQLSDDGAYILLPLSGRLYLVDRATKAVRELPTGKGFLLDPKFSPDGKKISYVRDHDVYVFDLDKGKELRVTTGGPALVE